MRKSAAFILITLVIEGCVPIGDAAFKIRGQFVDSSRSPYTDCQLMVKYGEQVAKDVRISGTFQETVVFHPKSKDPLVILGTCTGARESYEQRIDTLPKSFDEYIDVGQVILK